MPLCTAIAKAGHHLRSATPLEHKPMKSLPSRQGDLQPAHCHQDGSQIGYRHHRAARPHRNHTERGCCPPERVLRAYLFQSAVQQCRTDAGIKFSTVKTPSPPPPRPPDDAQESSDCRLVRHYQVRNDGLCTLQTVAFLPAPFSPELPDRLKRWSERRLAGWLRLPYKHPCGCGCSSSGPSSGTSRPDTPLNGQ